ncbi:DMT family transporter [Limnohabitans sp.]|jgi:drug/metabolite transporter (DMT)-like permease|uniref:DMT family transporter n=1 Tax=Limnohabitans sp. TaxID=1907725 RepID=UPI00286EE5F7|nr:DMT family transporter [Limnohabitans sp.]
MSESRNQAWINAMPWLFVLIWSTGFIVARYGMPNSPPFTFLLWRYIFSIACFVLWVKWARVPWPQGRSQWWHLAVTGMLMHAGYLGGVWAAVKVGMGAGLTALIVGLQPVITAIWLSARGGHVTRRQWQGLALGFVGLAMVVSRKLEGGIEVTSWSLTMITMALVSITTGTLYQKRFVQPCDVRSANAVQLMAAYLVTLPLALMETEPALWNAEMSWAMAWAVLVLTLGGSSLFYILIQRGAAAAVTSLLYLVPPTTAVMAWVLFNEPITWVTLAGILVTAMGVSLVVRPPKINN